MCDLSNPISDETLVLIKEKRWLRRQYSQNKDPTVKTRINQLQKQVNPINPGLLALELTLGEGVFHPLRHKTRTTSARGLKLCTCVGHLMFSSNIHFQDPSVFHDVTVTSQVRVSHKICAFSPCIYYFRFASEKLHKINET